MDFDHGSSKLKPQLNKDLQFGLPHPGWERERERVQLLDIEFQEFFFWNLVYLPLHLLEICQDFNRSGGQKIWTGFQVEPDDYLSCNLVLNLVLILTLAFYMILLCGFSIMDLIMEAQI
jgi:hypothetical protein